MVILSRNWTMPVDKHHEKVSSQSKKHIETESNQKSENRKSSEVLQAASEVVKSEIGTSISKSKCFGNKVP